MQAHLRTLLFEAGVAMRVVQEIFRHSSMTLTANTYGHVRPVEARQAMDQFADLWGTRTNHGLWTRIRRRT